MPPKDLQNKPKPAPVSTAKDTQIETVLDQMADLQKLVETNLNEVPLRVRAGHAIRQEAARTELAQLTKDLERLTLGKRLAGVFGSGDSAAIAATANYLSQNAGIFVPGDMPYMVIAAELHPGMGASQVFGVHQYSRACRDLRENCERENIRWKTPPDYREVVCASLGDVVAEVRHIARATVGDELVIRHVTDCIIQDVVDLKLTGRWIPVLVTGIAEEERPALAAIFARSAVHEFDPGVEMAKDQITQLFSTTKT